MTQTINPADALVTLQVSDVSSVYSGRDGRCCCGCSGKHSYNSALVAFASKDRGYAVTNDEVNDRMVARVLRIMKDANEHEPRVVEYDEFGDMRLWSTVIGTRRYVVYAKGV